MLILSNIDFVLLSSENSCMEECYVGSTLDQLLLNILIY